MFRFVETFHHFFAFCLSVFWILLVKHQRLSFELLVKSLLNNNKSLENQIREIGSRLNNANASPELCNMIVKIITYYTDFQNHHIKHDDSVNEDEIEYIIELTSVVMKYLIKVIGGTLNDKT